MIEVSVATLRDRIANVWQSWASDRSGASAVEFSIVVLPFIACVFMVFQFGLYYFGVEALEHASAKASRRIMTGVLPGSAYSLATFRTTEICPNLLMALDCSKVIVNAYKVSPSSDAAAGTGIYQFVNATSKVLLAPPAQSTFCVGGPGDYVFLDIAYELPSFLGSMLSPSGSTAPKSFMVRSTSFFRNEMFLGDGQAC